MGHDLSCSEETYGAREVLRSTRVRMKDSEGGVSAQVKQVAKLKSRI